MDDLGTIVLILVVVGAVAAVVFALARRGRNAAAPDRPNPAGEGNRESGPGWDRAAGPGAESTGVPEPGDPAPGQRPQRRDDGGGTGA